MRRRALGTTGLEVSEIGCGCWGLGGDAYGELEERAALAVLEQALDLGIDFFDTSDLYGAGRSERLLGAALRGRREQALIATKGGTLPHRGFVMPQDFSRDHLRRALEGSLARLGTDHVDLYQLHSPTLEALLADESPLETLIGFQAEGLVRAWGISVRSPADGLAALERWPIPVLQVNFNLIDQRAKECGLLALAAERGTGIIVRTPLVFGFLTGALTGAEELGERDHRSNWPADQRARWAGAAGLFAHLAPPGTPVQLALRFCLAQPGVSTVIPGLLTPEQAREDAAAAELPPLAPDALEEIEAIYRANRFYDPTAKTRAGV